MSASKLFTREEEFKIIEELGMGRGFDFLLKDGNVISIELNSDGQFIVTGSTSRGGLNGIMAAWMAEGWRRKQNYSGEYGIDDLVELTEWFGRSEFSTMPVDDALVIIKAKLDEFWTQPRQGSGFRPTPKQQYAA